MGLNILSSAISHLFHLLSATLYSVCYTFALALKLGDMEMVHKCYIDGSSVACFEEQYEELEND